MIKSMMIRFFNPTTCDDYPQLASYGIDCNCPFNIASGVINLQDIELELLDYSQTLLAYFSKGDFDWTIKMTDALGAIGSLQVQFSVKQASSN